MITIQEQIAEYLNICENADEKKQFIADVKKIIAEAEEE